jgi:hypothetical protein
MAFFGDNAEFFDPFRRRNDRRRVAAGLRGRRASDRAIFRAGV